MKRELLKTGDGSTTIHLPDINEQYHSKHGAIQESKHVFLAKGLSYIASRISEIDILEIGFGTGLNALLTFFESKKTNLKINYTAVEAYPVIVSEWSALNYGELINREEGRKIFEQMHSVAWEQPNSISENFRIYKQEKKFEDIVDINTYDLIYFDAFGARVQPELWTETIFEIMYKAMKKGGVLVTYSAKGSARRAMQAVGFEVERLEGPPGKREMLRATK